ncbi:hypothetical protein G6514_007330 [Epicoccum nigrum]|nr:hypothetical protein G6514_007330 [Epicoccum nigrum]
MADLTKETSFEDIVQSDLFTFYIGKERQPFIVHSKAVAATSAVFDRLINGDMSEARSRSAEFQEIDPATFIRFLEYAYRHDYATPQPTQVTTDTQASVSGAQELLNSATPSTHWTTQVLPVAAADRAAWANSTSAPSDYCALPSPPMATRKQIRSQGSARALFNRRKYGLQALNGSSSSNAREDVYQNMLPSQSFAPVFLAHARLYALAEMHMVLPLRDLTLHKLHHALAQFQLFPERLTDIVELARFAYEQGADRAVAGKIDPLRDMVVDFVACEKKALSKDPEFRNLMDGGGEFAGDFWDVVSREEV